MGEKTLQQHIDYKFHCIYVLYKKEKLNRKASKYESGFDSQ